MDPIEKHSKKSNKGGIVAGTIIILVGLGWLLREMGVYVPYWLFSWEAIIIVVGMVIGVNTRFQSPMAYILMVIGGVFIIDDIIPFSFNIANYLWPVALIIIGIVVILKPKRKKNWDPRDGSNKRDSCNWEKEEVVDSSEKLDGVSIFNASKKNVISKKFRGGEIVTIFGGSEINLTHADFEGRVELEVVIIFGGLKLVVPPNWQVQTNVTNILAGVEDKRSTQIEVVADNKTLVIDGTVIFGGIEIQNF